MIRALFQRIVRRIRVLVNPVAREQREHMKAWIAALRSGAYVQGKYTLRTTDNKFCCLGVACDISGLGAWRLPQYSDGYEYVVAADETERSSLPPSVQEYFGVSQANPVLGVVGDDLYPTNAVSANDRDSRSYAEIADALERMYL